MRVNDKKYFSYNWDTLKLKTAESIGSRFPVHQTRLPGSNMPRISFSSSKTALQFILGLPRVEGSRRFVNGAEKVTSVFFGGKEVFADEGQGKQQDKKREIPKECKTCEGATSYKNIKAADGSGSNNKSTNTHYFTCNNPRTKNALSVNPYNIISGEKEKKNKSQEKGGTDRISRNRGNVEYSSISISGHEVTR